MRRQITPAILVGFCLGVLLPASGATDEAKKAEVQRTVAQTIEPLMTRYGVPGMTVGIVVDGQSYVFNYGVASKTAAKPITDDTLFEIGSITKTFTATLVSYAQVTGQLSLLDPASQGLPTLKGSSFDQVSLLNLGTHTTGGLPLQVPDEVTNDDQLMRYFREWKPSHPPGTYRNYGNPGIGLLGLIAARSLHENFVDLMEGKLLPALGLHNTFLRVPPARQDDYAQGYTEEDAPIRLVRDVLSDESGGLKTTAGDLLHFVEANLQMLTLAEPWQRAIIETHKGYYRVGPMTQDLVWEQYPYPVTLPDLLAGNSEKIIMEGNPTVRLDPPLPPQADVLINKTGSTNGFAAYVAFVPARKAGIVILANKRYPIDARVTAAHEILTRLVPTQPNR